MNHEHHFGPPHIPVANPEGFQDASVATPSERLLQLAWLHQRLRTGALTLVDGRPLRVLHPGFWNREAGPDFRRAVLRFGDEPPCQGDVELDLHASGWRSHHHQGNPRYARVILHVVWRSTGRPESPTLEMEPHLELPWQELARWHGSGAADGWPPQLSGQCRMPLQSRSDAEQAILLQRFAEERLAMKVERLRIRSEGLGPAAAFWGSVFRALGYKQNPWPMQLLGETIVKHLHAEDTVQTLQGRLLGLSGLLPDELPRQAGESQEYQRSLWDGWWRERDALAEHRLPRSVWQLNQVRPANRPERRLALASHWLADPHFMDRVDRWGDLLEFDPTSAVAELGRSLQVGEDPFWSQHWTFRSGRFSEPRPLLGKPRATDLAMNVLLPWLHWKAGVAGQSSRTAAIRACYLDWPSAQDNAILRLARHRLLRGEESRCLLRKAAAQQGLLQIVNDYCDHSNSLCDQCPFPEELRSHANLR